MLTILEQKADSRDRNRLICSVYDFFIYFLIPGNPPGFYFVEYNNNKKRKTF